DDLAGAPFARGQRRRHLLEGGEDVVGGWTLSFGHGCGCHWLPPSCADGVTPRHALGSYPPGQGFKGDLPEITCTTAASLVPSPVDGDTRRGAGSPDGGEREHAAGLGAPLRAPRAQADGGPPAPVRRRRRRAGGGRSP